MLADINITLWMEEIINISLVRADLEYPRSCSSDSAAARLASFLLGPVPVVECWDTDT